MEKSTVCGKVCYVLTDETILPKLNLMWSKGAKEFPGPQPVSIERKHLNQLKEKPYIVCDKSDGMRYGLVCFTREEKSICALINRNLEAMMIKANVPIECYKGTILDGEMLEIEGEMTFLIYDCVTVSGQDISTFSFKGRLEMAEEISKSITTEYFKLRMKKIYDYEQVRTCLKNMEELDYKTDGLIFIPNDCAVKAGRHDDLFKWKKQYDNTVDFAIKSDDKKTLYLQKAGQLVKTLNKLETLMEVFEGTIIVECKCVNIEKRIWELVMKRPDKNLPNSLYTFRKTLINIKENIDVNEFG
jgi:hypothetical protein